LYIKQLVKCFLVLVCLVSVVILPVQASLLFGSHRGGQPPDIWSELRSSFKLPDAVNQPEVQRQIHWLVTHPSYLRKIAEQSEPYIYHIISTIKERHLPGELALLPMIESSYDPYAYSGSGAQGLWQLMPGTGSHLGVKRSIGYDGRRDIIVSTDAALNHLTYLQNFFHGNWILALAAYDSGEGTVQKAVHRNTRNNKAIDFWSLDLPRETQNYVPRLLAIAAIVRHPSQYHVKLPNLLYQPYFEKVELKKQIDFKQAAKLAKVTVADISQLNPGYNKKTTTSTGPKKLLLPVESVPTFKANYENRPIQVAEVKKDEVAAPTTTTQTQQHKIGRGETLGQIAKQYHTSVASIQKANHLRNNRIRQGRVLVIPGRREKEPAALVQLVKNTPRYYHVRRGDSLDKIAHRNHISLKLLRQLNHLGSGRMIKPGQKLILTA